MPKVTEINPGRVSWRIYLNVYIKKSPDHFNKSEIFTICFYITVARSQKPILSLFCLLYKILSCVLFMCFFVVLSLFYYTYHSLWSGYMCYWNKQIFVRTHKIDLIHILLNGTWGHSHKKAASVFDTIMLLCRSALSIVAHFTEEGCSGLSITHIHKHDGLNQDHPAENKTYSSVTEGEEEI